MHKKHRIFGQSGIELHKCKKWLQGHWFLIMEVLLMIAICLMHALAAGNYVDFYPINGTFQNFNPVRRFLDGQIPYKDFADYLGIGHLYSGTVGTALFGGDYRGSLIAFSFLNFFCLAALSCMIGKAVFRDWKMVIGASNAVLAMLIIQPSFFVNALGLTSDIKDALNAALDTGNSARFLRGLILPLCIGFFGIMVLVYEKYKVRFHGRKIDRFIPAAAAGLLAGFSFIWSNDYGVICFVCVAIMTFWLSLSRNRNVLAALVNTVIEVLSSLVSIFILVEIFTMGHFGQWFQVTLGTGGYQSWYYNSSKSYYLYDVDITYIMLIQAFLAAVYLLILFAKKGTRTAVLRYGIPGFANMVGFGVVNEYRILSGGGCREVALSVLFLTIMFETMHFMGNLWKSTKLRHGFLLASLLICTAWSLSAAKEAVVFSVSAEKEGEYIASMGGNMTRLYTDMQAASDFLDGADFFATYASAQEVMERKFQPSGTDYIIHVLGDAQRERYLSDFQTGDFRYAVTINKGFTDWEYWCERANWYFYRELYQNWHPVFANTYQIYWERNAREKEFVLSEDYNIEIQPLDHAAMKLILRTDQSVNGIADIFIDYSVDKDPDSRLAKFLFRKNMKVENTGALFANDADYESNYLRSAGAEYIPMNITNGYGELTLTASPARCVVLNLEQVRCDSIYTAANILQVHDLTDRNWNAGISSQNDTLLFRYTEGLLARLESAKCIYAGDEKFNIKDTKSDSDWIQVTVDRDAKACAFPAILHVGGIEHAG